MKVAVLVGHPRPGSYGHALAQAYAAGARAAGHEVVVVDLAQLRFDPDVHPMSPVDQPLEPDLAAAWSELAAASHWMLVWPAWWSMAPARLVGFLDRVLLPGVAFRETPEGRYEGLLKGRTAHLVVTLDTPPAVWRLVYRAPAWRALRDGTLGLCGVATTATRLVGPVKHGGDAARRAWIEELRAMGASLAAGPRAADPWRRAKAWLRALRLQFYPMTWMAYTLGSVLGAAPHPPDGWRYALGYALLFVAEAATVFINDLVDAPSDARNAHASALTGGSRVLHDGWMSKAELRLGAGLALLATLALAGLLLATAPGWPLALAVAALLLLAWGYTLPPVRLAWRGLGELDVAVTHSFGVLLIGHLLQGGAWQAALPWMLALPLALAVLPAILLSGVPDHDADAAVGKRTLVVRLGIRRAIALAQALVLAAALLATGMAAAGAVDGLFRWLLPVALPHAALLIWQLQRLRVGILGARRIDAELGSALVFLTWFAALPLAAAWVSARPGFP